MDLTPLPNRPLAVGYSVCEFLTGCYDVLASLSLVLLLGYGGQVAIDKLRALSLINACLPRQENPASATSPGFGTPWQWLWL